MPARFWAVAEGGRRRRRSLGGVSWSVGLLVGVGVVVAYRAASKGSAIVFLVGRFVWDS